ncbi:hypothetical protein DFA_09568 [Cavenderia fasciculata]|uniref:Uncharacterized protein n=1 Tax=Cavenderia fasciculata TaxID=261658 RepID=F4Q7Z9_CACFS|nr:uncharacterized protein DFA_09568 [Cavenderia fasciculata]EGG15899.1 hypothetical protein DFA_09568 [Cavenderia fasciculata]|eukprot:XP_004352224.1 hypothetical protein DFA_09568 [Cavenderia fasciculata]
MNKQEEEGEEDSMVLLPNLPFLIQAKIFRYVNEIGFDLVCSRFFQLATSIFTTLDFRLIKREFISNADCLLLGHDKPTITQEDGVSTYRNFIKDPWSQVKAYHSVTTNMKSIF